MRFVVVTGMSGGGKSTALRMLEDVGFYCVDNLPVPLIEKFVELIATPGGEVRLRLALMCVLIRLLRMFRKSWRSSKQTDILLRFCLWRRMTRHF